jgi:hypothetical protein
LLIETANIRAALVPHALEAVTTIVPEDEPAVTVILLVDDVPDQPEGNVQL